MSGVRPKKALSGIAVSALALTAFLFATPAHADDLNSQSSGETAAVPAPLSPEVENSASIEDYTQEELDQFGGDPRVIEYWTPERMANAIPVETPAAPNTDTEAPESIDPDYTSEADEEVVVEPTEATDSHLYPSPAAPPPVTNFTATNGKVFYQNATNGRNYVCSGSAINSGSKRLVSTAGHCVHGGPGGIWHQNWIFVPAYFQGSQPYGAFSANTLRTFTDWINYGESGRGFNSDVAFVTTYSNASGSRVVNAVGCHGLWSGDSRAFDVSLFGYPANLNDGQRMRACWGTSGSRWIGHYHFSSISGCDFGGGASGGPWLYQYSNNTGLGYLRTVNSVGPRGSTAYIAGPYFDSRVVNLYNTANGDW